MSKNLQDLIMELSDLVGLDRGDCQKHHFFNKNELQQIITTIRTLKKMAGKSLEERPHREEGSKNDA